MPVEHHYEVSVTWDEDRKGTIRSESLPAKIEVATPPQFTKGIEGFWSPEHLFVAAINSCLMTTFLAIAENSKLQFEAFESRAVGKLELIEGKHLMTEVVLKPTVVIGDEAHRKRAIRVLQKSELACLISNSVKSKIIVKPFIKVSNVVGELV